MKLLEPNEYDASYFDGQKNRQSHNAGYSVYEKKFRSSGENSLGEYYKDTANKLKEIYSLEGKKVLEIGCAKGFVVQSLRELGVDAYGLDISSYAIGEAESWVKPYLNVGDARTYLVNYKSKEFDLVLSIAFIECLTDKEAETLSQKCTRIGELVLHVTENDEPTEYYNGHSVEKWKAILPPGVLVDNLISIH